MDDKQPDNPAIAPEVDPFRPTGRRQKLVIVAVTVATVVGLWVLLLKPPHVQPIPGSQRGRCLPGQTSGCVGGQADVTLVPAPTPSSGASR
ncbi:hypothetical protein [Ideonella sp. YS5]|uniref:hypothetical protein n=1 Tax=Ideonella sp. YS5 TaxID=3453714 RepID=UPI003EEF8DFD